MNEIEKLIKSLDPSVIGKLKSFANTGEGKKIISRFSSMNKDELIKKVGSMTEEEKNAILSKMPVDPETAKKLKNLKG